MKLHALLESKCFDLIKFKTTSSNIISFQQTAWALIDFLIVW